MIFSGSNAGRGAWDQNIYHLVAIRRFADVWPRFDLRDYESATTPGFHLVIATVARFISADLPILRIAGSLFTAALIGLVAWFLSARLRGMQALALTLPLITSMYVFFAGAWLLPDNAGWLGVAAVLVMVLGVSAGADRARDMRHLIVAGTVLTLLVLVRQMHIWAAALVWMAAWLDAARANGRADPERAEFSVSADVGELFSRPRDRAARTALALLATLPAIAALGYFVQLWDGLSPPMFRKGMAENVGRPESTYVGGGNPATPAFILSLIAIMGPFYTGYIWERARALLRSPGARTVIITAALIGLVIAVIPETSWSGQSEGKRYSGLWNVVKRLPVIAERSPLIIGLAPVGAALLGLWACVLPFRLRWLFVTAWAAFIAAQTASSNSWQRYYEPFIVMAFAFFSAALAAQRGAPDTLPLGARIGERLRVAGPLALAGMLGVVTIGMLAVARDAAKEFREQNPPEQNAREQNPREQNPPAEAAPTP